MFGSTLDPERAFDRMPTVTRTGVRRRRLALTVALALLAAAWAGPVARAVSDGPVHASSTRYVVREGDTLWSIARHLADGEDPRPLVDAIQAANRVDPAALVPGRTLLIPAG